MIEVFSASTKSKYTLKVFDCGDGTYTMRTFVNGSADGCASNYGKSAIVQRVKDEIAFSAFDGINYRVVMNTLY